VGEDLDSKGLFFKHAMVYNFEEAMALQYTMNPLTGLWQLLGANLLLQNQSFFKFLKVFELVVVKVVSFVEDERVFLFMNFVKCKVHNKLWEHLDYFVYLFVYTKVFHPP